MYYYFGGKTLHTTSAFSVILRAHLVSEQAKRDDDGGIGEPNGPFVRSIARTQLIGRLLIPTLYMYHASRPVLTYSYSEYALQAVVCMCMVAGCALVSFGLSDKRLDWIGLPIRGSGKAGI